MKIKHVINLHKALTAPVVLGLMVFYQNFTLGPWVYLALHGTYGVMWLLKDRIYPDKQWEPEIPIGIGIIGFGILMLYWVAPFIKFPQAENPVSNDRVRSYRNQRVAFIVGSL
ncbi:hypothetical protein BJP36_22030 [Moorena producens JHB]|uniref:Uncharacterized protein n=1 Tax=Moorena producens (strain JHB) TaxID=1454205 RepID=A0A9Q9SS89_MOOP1|nr:hypothetical protein [Moorena producens]WAN68708.1 hypothetical protein BJP36_22030 [Moorena producens JHB]